MEFQDNFKQFVKAGEKFNENEVLEQQEEVGNSKEAASASEEERPLESMKQTSKEKTVKSTRKGKNVGTPRVFDITFQDLVEQPCTPLKNVYHKPVFALPIHTNPLYKKFTVQERIQLMSNYHTKISELQMKVARTSLHMAPWSKPIPAANSSKYLLESPSSDNTFFDNFDEIPPRDFYVSRAGRQIKRKIYTEDEDADSETEFAVSAKKTKAPDSDIKITFDSPFTFEETNSKQSTPKLMQNQEKDNTTQKTRKGTPTIKKTFVPVKLSRTEQLFDQMKREDRKKQQQEEEMAKFEETLPESHYEDDIFVDSSPVKEVAETFMRKRIVPPLPTKRAGRPKKQVVREGTKKTNKTNEASGSSALSPPTSPVLKRFEKKFKNIEMASKAKVLKPIGENSGLILQKKACPICEQLFLQSEIENHAANCGIDDNDFDNAQPAGNSNNSTQMSCSTCDKVFVSGTTYQDHVKQCVASTITNM